MDKKKIIYIGILLIVTVLISVTYFSYAFFTSRIEQHGKLNIVAGTLDYQIESNDLVNNAITLESNTTKVIEIKITSLNDINSKYELYYNSNNNIEIGYDNNNDSPTGIINKNESKNSIITIKNKNSNPATVTFGVEGGLISNNLILSIGNSITEIINNNCLYESGYVWDFPFDPDGDGKGQEQVFTVPCNGDYQLEVWGAQGGTYNSTYVGGYGAYSIGKIALNANIPLYINVGGAGIGCNSYSKKTHTRCDGGYNGGGSANSYYYSNSNYSISGTGGGATDIRIDDTGLSNRIFVAGGGGGALYYAADTRGNGAGGAGGGMNGNSTSKPVINGGGTQTAGGVSGTYLNKKANDGQLGIGGDYVSNIGCGGGGGFYGGAGSYYAAAAGGSGYIASPFLVQNTLSNIVNKMYCYNCTESSEFTTYTVSTYGTTTHENERDTTNCPNGYSSNPVSKCAMANNGYARITYLGN